MSFGTHCDSRRGYDYPRAFLKLISFALLDKIILVYLEKSWYLNVLNLPIQNISGIQTILTCTLRRISN